AVGESTGSAATPCEAIDEEAARREKAIVGDVKDEIAYRESRARHRFERGPVVEEKKEQISRAIDRGIEQVDTQAKRVDAALAEKDPGSFDHVKRLREEVAALGET